ncbi:hypothetical protein OV207_01935 [Corallococcus sp. BB11-1]|uniref:outer membrane exchange protein TraA family protein n=1 Tax=Corallococcus sp. BB11-1 TaxID=2996783 RepID=UPI0010D42F41|nr:outer membrane exchange protein TraA family protein [Corallococcus sp. BB11-1]MCY1030199.1 hypothetical protein [Corallococcus sp. BB11-1]RYZ47030.1 MAG: hypothetical protein EOO72_00540 [Myxococcaceae bacterium]
MRPFLSFILVLCALVLSPPASAQPVQVVVTGAPIAPLPDGPGTGLCSVSSRWLSPASDLPQSQATYVGGINAFMEGSRARWITSVLRTDTDLSNNFDDGGTLSQGDFTGACGAGGCAFAYSGGSTIFATRLRGFIAISEAQVGKSLHFGLYADDSVSLTLYDRAAQSYTVVVRPPTLGIPTWRLTSTVVFQQAGLYGVEVLHAQVSEHAALELSLFEGTFTDFERPANQPPVVNLRTEGFALIAPEQFHQAESGGASFSSLDQCVQCSRQEANTAGNGGCGTGYRCNAAALCAPCDSAASCGASCSPCGASTPFCSDAFEDFRCVQCRTADDCPAPDACHTTGCSGSATCSSSPVPDGTECPGGTCQDGTCESFDAGVDGGGSEPGEDAGSLDGSVSEPDGGATGPSDAGTAVDAGARDAGSSWEDEGPDISSCGCGSGASGLAPMALVGLALFARRSRRHPARHH